MPLPYQIDQDRELVIAMPSGVLTDREVFAYQHEVWSQPAYQNYDELFDLTEVSHLDMISIERVPELAELARHMDASFASRLAIVATTDLHFGLARMYQAYRELGRDKSSPSRMHVFRDRESALQWLMKPGSRA